MGGVGGVGGVDGDGGGLGTVHRVTELQSEYWAVKAGCDDQAA